MLLIVSTALELGGVVLIAITIIHLLVARLRIRALQRASGGRANELIEIIEDAEHKHATLPAIWEISVILTGVALNISGIFLRFLHELFVYWG